MTFSPGSLELEIIKLFGAAILGFLSALAMEYKRRYMSKNQRIAQYLSTIAAALEGIADGFDKCEKPYKHGHFLKTALKKFDKTIGSVLGQEKKLYLLDLSNVVESADNTDGILDRPCETTEGQRMKVSKDARRTAGDLLGKAAELMAK